MLLRKRPVTTIGGLLALSLLACLAGPAAPAAAQDPSYPVARGQDDGRVWIEKVRFSDTRYTSDKSGKGYQDLTRQTITLYSGSQEYFSLHPRHGSNVELPVYWRVWMDLNLDGDFDDVVDGQSELVVQNPNAHNGSSVKGMFQNYVRLPAGFGGLTTRMRVAMKQKLGDASAAPGPAEIFDSGEVEDYRVRLLAMPEAPDSAPTNLRVSNIGPTTATVRWDSVPDASSYQIRYREPRHEGLLTQDTFFHTARATSTTIRLHTLSADTEYQVTVRASNAGGSSDDSDHVSFKTVAAEGDSVRHPTVGLHPSGAPFTLGQDKAWALWDPFVLYDADDGLYKVWYTVWGGHEFDFYQNRVMGVGHAWSEDGIRWTRQPGGHVLLPTPGSWDKDGLETVSVVKNDGTYYLWYLGKNYTPYLHQLGLATSTDGRIWTKHARNPVLSPEQPFEGDTVKEPSVIWDADEGIFKMWYNGMRSSERVVRVGYATSTDGIAWQKKIGPVNGEGSAGWNHVNVVKLPGGRGYQLYVLVNYSVLQFWSQDGISGWTPNPNGPVLRARTIGHTWNGAKHDFENILAYGSPSALVRGGRLELYHMRSWYYATEYGDQAMRFGLATGRLYDETRIYLPLCPQAWPK